MDHFWKELTWSLYWLWKGEWLIITASGSHIDTVRAGTKLVGGYYCTFWHSLGDLDWHSNVMGLEGQRDIVLGSLRALRRTGEERGTRRALQVRHM